MSDPASRFQHDLHKGPCVLFTLPDDLNRSAFLRALDIIEREGGVPVGASGEEHWKALEERARGGRPWRAVVPAFQRAPAPDERDEWLASLHIATNVITRRGYRSYIVDGIQYVIDVFNPKNELELSYRGAGEPVLMLLLAEATLDPKQPFQTSPIRDHLGDLDSFYRIVSGFVALLNPRDVSGGAFLPRVMMAYHSGDLPPDSRPWDLLWTLSSLNASEMATISEERLRAAFSKVIQAAGGTRTLVQVVPRFDSVMSREYVPAARLLGRLAVTEVGDQGSRTRRSRR